MNELDELRKLYLSECTELLLQLEEYLARLEASGADADAVNGAFRAVHSVKGGAGAFGYDRLQDFAHLFESVLGLVREGSLAADETVAGELLRAGDLLADLVREAQGMGEVDAAREQAASTGLNVYLGAAAEDGGGDCAPDNLDDMVARLMAASGIEDDVPAGDVDHGDMASETVRAFTIHFRPLPDCLVHGNEPRLLFSALAALGEVEIEPDLTGLPPLDRIDPAVCAIAWVLRLTTTATRQDIEDVFAFVADDADLTIEDGAGGGDDSPRGGTMVEAIPAEDYPSVASDHPPPAQPPSRSTTGAAAGAPSRAIPSPPPPAITLRVDLDRVDRLVDLVGEIAITQAVLAQQSQELLPDQHGLLIQAVEELTQQMRALQESVMAIRTQPVRAVFQKMPRLVRDLADKTGKKMRLVLTGEETEIDKTVIERLGDPLTHLIRNAADHGLEGPDERVAAGKTAEGTIRLAAAQRSGRIVIDLTDDGRGIDLDRVLGKAVERGLVAAGTVLSPEEIINLIFAPGFSTAESVTDISGRGVGMDVVRANITELGGRISVRSEPGQGSTFTLALPLTLAVMDGIACRVGRQTYLLPVANVIESLQLDHKLVRDLIDVRRVMVLREQSLQLIWLRELFAVTDGDATNREIVVIVETEDGLRFGLVVDELIGQYQVVVKSLDRHYRRVLGVAAATILGDGRVAMILDVPGLSELDKAKRRDRRSNGNGARN